MVSTGRGGAGLGERRPQDSVYYHPTLNPTGRPPPGKPQKYKAVADCDEEKEDGDEEDDDEEEIDEEFGFGGFGLPLAAGTSTRPLVAHLGVKKTCELCACRSYHKKR